MKQLRISWIVCIQCSLAIAITFSVFASSGPGTNLRNQVVPQPEFWRRFEAWSQAAKPDSRVWIKFTDHGSASGQLVPMSERAIARRLKRGVPLITADRQPVAPEYVQAVLQSGATIHHISRWMNAVSVVYDADVIDRIASLSFVAGMQPVAGYRQFTEPDETGRAIVQDHLRSAASSLDYGGSLAQIQQIAADVAHGRGYSGDGVLVAMFDTGFRKDHEAFAEAIAGSRLIAEWDFVFGDGNVQNEPEDNPNAHNHGTSTWSCLGGSYPGQMYGTAYGASFLLAKTEDIRSETQVEEDNWLAAVEWADSLGADVISSSLTYSDWYSLSDYDGLTCVTTVAANLAATLGIVVCNSAGNGGPNPQTFGAPVDGLSIVSAGSVSSGGFLSGFSSRGPTFDGRLKPEVCAQGSATFLAQASSTTAAGTSSGTSFACPLVGGCAALILEANPSWTPMMVREALMQTASQASTPDNNLGWGIVNVNSAIDYTGSVTLTAQGTGDTVKSIDTSIILKVVASSVSSVDPAQSAVYYRVDGGSYTPAPLLASAGDTLEGLISWPQVPGSVMDYYFVVRDSVGFSARAPESLSTFYSFVWESLSAGDTDGDGLITAADIIFLVNFVFKSGPSPNPQTLGEVDGIVPVNASDIIYLVNFVFKSGPPPVGS